MSAQGFNRMLFLERRKAMRKQRLNFWFVVTCCLFAATATHFAAFLIGHRVGYELAQEHERQKPKKVAMQSAPAIFNGVVECVRVCRARERMNGVVAK